MKINKKDTIALKKDVMADINQHNQYAILSSKGNEDLAVLLVATDKESNNTSPELYQLVTKSATPLKKGRDEKIAKRFYKEQLAPIVGILKSVNVKTLILDYNLSFWVYQERENLANFLARESGVDTVWANVKTRVSKEEDLKKLLPKSTNYHTTPLTPSGIIALSLLKSYSPELIKNTAIFNVNLSKNVADKFESDIEKLKKKNPNKKIPLPTMVNLEDVFDVNIDKENASELEALEWALTQARNIRNPKYEKTFKKLVERAKKPVLDHSNDTKRKIIKPRK